jgi:hypothetical protein
MSGNANIYGLIVDGYDGTGDYATIGINCAGGTSFAVDVVNTCTVRNCSTAGVKVTGDGTTQFGRILLLKFVTSQVTVGAPFSTGAGYEIEEAGLISGVDVNCSGFLSGGGIMDRGFYVHGDFSYIDISVSSIFSCTDGIVVGGGTTSNSAKEYPIVRMSVLKLGLISGNALETLAKGWLYVNSGLIDDDLGTFPSQIDLKNTNPALPANRNVVILQDCVLNVGKTDLENGASNNKLQLNGLVFSSIQSEEQVYIASDTAIGFPTAGRHLIVGEGSPHTTDMVVLQDDGGVFTDITTRVNRQTYEPIAVDIATTSGINLSSAPATVDGISPSSGVTRVLVKDGSTANPGTDSVDNGIYLWNGTGSAMTRTSDFASSATFDHATFFVVDTGTANYGSAWVIDPVSIPGDTVTVGTTAFVLKSSSSPLFPLSPVNDDALYIGSTSTVPIKFVGLEMLLTKPITLSSGGVTDAITCEYWNGSAWVTMSIMSTHANPPYNTFANATYGFGDTSVGNPDTVPFHYRFGDTTDWATTSVNGVAGYWFRCRCIVAANINQIAVIEQIKIQTNSMEIDPDGYIEFFGAARPSRKMFINSKMIYETGGGIGFSNPSDESLTAASGISAKVKDGQMDDGSDVSQTFILEMPNELDTSAIVQMKVSFVTESASNGNIQIRADYAFTRDGYSIGTPGGSTTATARSTGNQTVAVIGDETQHSHVLELDMTEFNPSLDTLWLQFVREGSSGSDTFNGQIYVFTWTLVYKVWASGGHGLN